MNTENLKRYKSIMPITTRLDPEVLEDLGFFEAPASTKYHGAYEGGLF